MEEKFNDGTGYILHWACTQHRAKSFFEFLIDTFPNPVKETDDKGQHAVHLACWNRLSESIITLLIDK